MAKRKKLIFENQAYNELQTNTLSTDDGHQVRVSTYILKISRNFQYKQPKW
jgi:hypothetical protein